MKNIMIIGDGYFVNTLRSELSKNNNIVHVENLYKLCNGHRNKFYKVLQLFKNINRIKSSIKNNQIDVINFHFVSTQTLFSILLCKFFFKKEKGNTYFLRK